MTYVIIDMLVVNESIIMTTYLLYHKYTFNVNSLRIEAHTESEILKIFLCVFKYIQNRTCNVEIYEILGVRYIVYIFND